MERLKVAVPTGKIKKKKKDDLLDELEEEKDEENIDLEDLEEPSLKQKVRLS